MHPIHRSDGPPQRPATPYPLNEAAESAHPVFALEDGGRAPRRAALLQPLGLPSPENAAFAAARRNDAFHLRKALESGANLDARRGLHTQRTLLMEAVVAGDTLYGPYAAANFLMGMRNTHGRGVDLFQPDSEGNTVFHIAARISDVRAMMSLMIPLADRSAGYPLDDFERALICRDAKGRTPLDVARAGYRHLMIQFLEGKARVAALQRRAASA